MVGFIIVCIALIAFILLLAFAYWKLGADQGKPGPSPDAADRGEW